MKKQMFFAVFLFLFTCQMGFGQSNDEWKNFLDDYCETYFEGCFYWKYYEIVSIKEVDPISSNKVKIKGRVKNGSTFGIPVIRNFIAEIKVYDEKIVVNFKKDGDIGNGPFWTDCKQTLMK